MSVNVFQRKPDTFPDYSQHANPHTTHLQFHHCGRPQSVALCAANKIYILSSSKTAVILYDLYGTTCYVSKHLIFNINSTLKTLSLLDSKLPDVCWIYYIDCTIPFYVALFVACLHFICPYYTVCSMLHHGSWGTSFHLHCALVLRCYLNKTLSTSPWRRLPVRVHYKMLCEIETMANNIK